MKLRRRPRQTLDRKLFGAINRLPHTKYLDEQISLLSDLGKGVGWTAGGAWLALRDGSRGQRAAAASVGGLRFFENTCGAGVELEKIRVQEVGARTSFNFQVDK